MAAQPVVFVVDDDAAVRGGLSALLASAGLAARTFETAQAFLDRCTPDCRGCVLLDVRMPGMSGLELQGQLAARGIGLPVIILTGHADVPMAVSALKGGALDFLEKPFNDQALLDRVRHALAVDAQRAAGRAQRQTWVERVESLTVREREVMEAIVAGKANKVIAIELGISERTVELHRAHVMQKLGVRSVAELVQGAVAAGVIAAPDTA